MNSDVLDVRKALKVLSGRLVFGNEEQIKAVKFISLVEAAVQAIDECKHGGPGCSECNGSGVVECNLGHEHDCDECDGTGGSSGCKCFASFSADVMEAAREIEKRGWPSAHALRRTA